MGVMKNTGVAWIGEIPLEWELGKVKYGFDRKKEKSTESDPVVLSLARAGVKVRDISTNEGQLAASYEGYNPVEPNDLLLNPMDLISGANCSISHVSGVISPAYMNLRARNGFDPRYYDYFFKTQYWSLALFAHGKGVSFDNRWTLNESTLRDYFIPMPSYQEQQAIADYLDDRCSKIDEIIAEATASIEEYKELKQAVIFEAVTKGINYTGRTKKSRIFWAQDIPETWDVIKVARSFSVELGKMLDEKRVSGERLRPYLRNADVQWFGINIDNLNEMDFSEEEDERYTVKPGDLLVCEGGDIGKSSIVPDDFPDGIYYQKALHRVRSYDNDSNSLKWLYYILYVMSKYGFFNAFSGEKATIQHLPAVTFNQIKFPMPKPEEKRTILKYLEEHIPEYDALISEKQALIDDLQAYKKSLIYEVVTGKRRVV